MYASSKSRHSLAVARGPITRVALAPRINNPATKVRWVIILKRGAYCCGTLVHHEKEKPISRRIPRLRSGSGLRAFRIAGGPAGGSSSPACWLREPCARASRARRRLADPCGFGSDRGSSRTPVRTEQAERLRTAIDTSTSCQVISCGATRGAMVKPKPAPSERRGSPLVLKELQQHPLPPLWPSMGAQNETQAHSDAAARDSAGLESNP